MCSTKAGNRLACMYMTASETENSVFRKVHLVSFLRLTSSRPYTSRISPVLIMCVPCMLRLTCLQTPNVMASSLALQEGGNFAYRNHCDHSNFQASLHELLKHIRKSCDPKILQGTNLTMPLMSDIECCMGFITCYAQEQVGGIKAGRQIHRM